MKCCLLFLLCVLPVLGMAQIKTNYLDKENKKCLPSEAYFVVTYDHGADSSKYIKTKMTVNDKLISQHELSDYNPEIYDGPCMVYFESSGKLHYKGQYEQNRQKGIWEYYFPDGMPMEIIDYNIPEEVDIEYLVLQAYDSIGNQTVTDSDGFYREILGKNNLLNKNDEKVKHAGFIEGEIKNGYKNGLWTGGKYLSKESYREEWQEGKLLAGTSTDSIGQEYYYQKIFVQPEPVKGLEGFYQFISKNMEYPKKARRMGVEGKVFVQFVVDKDGKLIDIIVVKGIGAGCDEQVLETVKKSPKWKNGFYRGMPVKVRMILPVAFKLT